MMVLAAGDAYCGWLMEAQDAGVFKGVIQSVRDEILAINKEVVGGDFTSGQEA
jgi:hypothetical protein